MDSGKEEVRSLEKVIIGLKAKLYDLQFEKEKSEKREEELRLELAAKEEAKRLEVKALTEKLEESQQNARLWNNAFSNLKKETIANEEEKKRMDDKEWIRKWEDSEMKKKLEEKITHQKAVHAEAQLVIHELTGKCAMLQDGNDAFLKNHQQVTGYLCQLATLVDLEFGGDVEDLVSPGFVKALLDQAQHVLEQKETQIASGEEFQRKFREFCASNAGSVMSTTDTTNVATMEDDAPFLSISAVSGASMPTENNELPSPTVTSENADDIASSNAENSIGCAQENAVPSSTGIPSEHPTCSKHSGNEARRTTRQTGKRQCSSCENSKPTKSAKPNRKPSS